MYGECMTDFFILFSETAYAWLVTHGAQIAFIVIGAFVAHLVSKHLLNRLVRRLVRQGAYSKQAEEKREQTLTQVLGGGAGVLIWLIAGMMLLSEFGIAIGPLLAAAGVAGLALGFGDSISFATSSRAPSSSSKISIVLATLSALTPLAVWLKTSRSA